MRTTALLLALACACESSAPTPSGGGGGGKIEFLDAPPSGDLATYVAGEVARGSRDRVPVLVYVGATWCEPCRDFHAAAVAGKLDAALGPLRLLEFDLDRDEPYLTAAGYTSKLVPLFARPDPTGKASGKQFSGVRSGGNYVEQLTPRVRSLLAAP